MKKKLVHVCLFDSECWIEWWEYGAPMRIHWNGKNPRFWTVISGAWIFRRRWDLRHTSGRGENYRCAVTDESFDDPRYSAEEQFRRHVKDCKRERDWLDWMLRRVRFKHPSER